MTTIQNLRDQIEGHMKVIRKYQEDIENLITYWTPGGKILNVGCSTGYETIALMWFLRANCVIGLDKNLSKVHTHALELKENLWVYDFKLPSNGLVEDKKWWENEVPRFLREGHFPIFLEEDISQFYNNFPQFKTLFDLVYWSKVMGQVHEFQKRPAVISAIEGIYYMTKFDAWVIVEHEHVGNDLDYLQEEFIRVGFEVIDEGCEYFMCLHKVRNPEHS